MKPIKFCTFGDVRKGYQWYAGRPGDYACDAGSSDHYLRGARPVYRDHDYELLCHASHSKVFPWAYTRANKSEYNGASLGVHSAGAVQRPVSIFQAYETVRHRSQESPDVCVWPSVAYISLPSDKTREHRAFWLGYAQSLQFANSLHRTLAVSVDARLGHALSVDVHVTSNSVSMSETNSILLHLRHRHPHRMADGSTALKLRLFLSIAGLGFRPMPHSPRRTPTDTIYRMQMLANAFIAYLALVSALDNFPQQHRRPAWLCQTIITRRLHQGFPQEQFDARCDLGWTTRTQTFLQAFTTFCQEPMQPTSNCPTTLARDPSNFRCLITCLSQQNGLHTAAQARALGLIIHLMQSLQLLPSNWFQFQWRSHGSPQLTSQRLTTEIKPYLSNFLKSALLSWFHLVLPTSVWADPSTRWEK